MKAVVTKSTTALNIPCDVFTPEVVELLEMFIQHRKELKKPLTHTSLQFQIRRLQKMAHEGVDVVAAIEHSIASGYQGIFPAPKSKAPWVDAREAKRNKGEQLQRALNEQGFDNFFDYLKERGG